LNRSELALYTQSPLHVRVEYSNVLSGASDLIPRGLFDRATGKPSPAKIFLVLETGAMLGLAPMAAIAGIDVIEGRAAISPRVALGLFRAAGHKVRIVEEGTVEGGNLSATVTLIRADDPDEPISASFSLRDALRASLVDSYAPNATGEYELRARSQQGKVLPWEAYPQDMVVWRAVSRLGRRGGQDVLMGIGYIPEELEALVNEDGVVERVDPQGEAAVIAEFKELVDKADMATVWHRENPGRVPSDCWTLKVQAEFAAHLSTLTVDTRPPAGTVGTPGNTGDKELDVAPAAVEPETAAYDVEPEPDEPEPIEEIEAELAPDVEEPQGDPAAPSASEWAEIRSASQP
jgi:hypothetical protein